MKKWSSRGKKRIREIKIEVLKKKLLMGFMIDKYSRRASIYDTCQLGVAVLAPLYGVAETYISESFFEGPKGHTVSIILSSLVASLIKIRDYIKYDQTRDTAKAQTIKYNNLYEKIEHEYQRSGPSNGKSENHFIYWIKREYENIELNDPELSYFDRKQFAELCDENHIPLMGEIDQLKKLLSVSDSQSNNDDKQAVHFASDVKITIKPENNNYGDNDDDDNDDDDNDDDNRFQLERKSTMGKLHHQHFVEDESSVDPSADGSLDGSKKPIPRRDKNPKLTNIELDKIDLDDEEEKTKEEKTKEEKTKEEKIKDYRKQIKKINGKSELNSSLKLLTRASEEKE